MLGISSIDFIEVKFTEPKVRGGRYIGNGEGDETEKVAGRATFSETQAGLGTSAYYFIVNWSSDISYCLSAVLYRTRYAPG